MGYRSSFMGSMTPMVSNIIIVSILCFLLNEFSGRFLSPIFALYPPLALTNGFIWQFATYLFLHGNLWHLLFNLLALWMFGNPLEGIWGSKRFLRYFFITGIGAGIASSILDFHSPPIVGNSGAIYGILVAFAITFPETEILAFLFFPMKAKHFVVLLGAIELYSSFQSSAGSNIAHIAHLSGAVIGYFILRPPPFNFQELMKRFQQKRKTQGYNKGDKSRPFTLLTGSSKTDLNKTNSNPLLSQLSDDFQAKVDAVLDKIRLHGMQSLSPEERRILELASDRLKEKRDQ